MKREYFFYSTRQLSSMKKHRHHHSKKGSSGKKSHNKGNRLGNQHQTGGKKDVEDCAFERTANVLNKYGKCCVCWPGKRPSVNKRIFGFYAPKSKNVSGAPAAENNRIPGIHTGTTSRKKKKAKKSHGKHDQKTRNRSKKRSLKSGKSIIKHKKTDTHTKNTTSKSGKSIIKSSKTVNHTKNTTSKSGKSIIKPRKNDNHTKNTTFKSGKLINKHKKTDNHTKNTTSKSGKSIIKSKKTDKSTKSLTAKSGKLNTKPRKTDKRTKSIISKFTNSASNFNKTDNRSGNRNTNFGKSSVKLEKMDKYTESVTMKSGRSMNKQETGNFATKINSSTFEKLLSKKPKKLDNRTKNEMVNSRKSFLTRTKNMASTNGRSKKQAAKKHSEINLSNEIKPRSLLKEKQNSNFSSEKILAKQSPRKSLPHSKALLESGAGDDLGKPNPKVFSFSTQQRDVRKKLHFLTLPPGFEDKYHGQLLEFEEDLEKKRLLLEQNLESDEDENVNNMNAPRSMMGNKIQKRFSDLSSIAATLTRDHQARIKSAQQQYVIARREAEFAEERLRLAKLKADEYRKFRNNLADPSDQEDDIARIEKVDATTDKQPPKLFLEKRDYLENDRPKSNQKAQFIEAAPCAMTPQSNNKIWPENPNVVVDVTVLQNRKFDNIPQPQYTVARLIATTCRDVKQQPYPIMHYGTPILSPAEPLFMTAPDGHSFSSQDNWRNVANKPYFNVCSKSLISIVIFAVAFFLIFGNLFEKEITSTEFFRRLHARLRYGSQLTSKCDSFLCAWNIYLDAISNLQYIQADVCSQFFVSFCQQERWIQESLLGENVKGSIVNAILTEQTAKQLISSLSGDQKTNNFMRELYSKCVSEIIVPNNRYQAISIILKEMFPSPLSEFRFSSAAVWMFAGRLIREWNIATIIEVGVRQISTENSVNRRIIVVKPPKRSLYYVTSREILSAAVDEMFRILAVDSLNIDSVVDLYVDLINRQQSFYSDHRFTRLIDVSKNYKVLLEEVFRNQAMDLELTSMIVVEDFDYVSNYLPFLIDNNKNSSLSVVLFRFFLHLAPFLDTSLNHIRRVYELESEINIRNTQFLCIKMIDLFAPSHLIYLHRQKLGEKLNMDLMLYLNDLKGHIVYRLHETMQRHDINVLNIINSSTFYGYEPKTKILIFSKEYSSETATDSLIERYRKLSSIYRHHMFNDFSDILNDVSVFDNEIKFFRHEQVFYVPSLYINLLPAIVGEPVAISILGVRLIRTILSIIYRGKNGHSGCHVHTSNRCRAASCNIEEQKVNNAMNSEYDVLAVVFKILNDRLHNVLDSEVDNQGSIYSNLKKLFFVHYALDNCQSYINPSEELTNVEKKLSSWKSGQTSEALNCSNVNKI